MAASGLSNGGSGSVRFVDAAESSARPMKSDKARRKSNRPRPLEVEGLTPEEIAEDSRRRLKMRASLVDAYEDLGRVRLEILHLESYARIRGEYFDFIMSTLESDEAMEELLRRKTREAEELALLLGALKARGDALACATQTATPEDAQQLEREDAATQTPARAVSPAQHVAVVPVAETTELLPLETEYVEVVRRRVTTREVAVVSDDPTLTPMMLWWRRWGNKILLFVTGYLLGRLTGLRAIGQLLPRAMT